jgi:hypothetical protein
MRDPRIRPTATRQATVPWYLQGPVVMHQAHGMQILQTRMPCIAFQLRTCCRYALLSVAACEASLQLQLPQYASVHEHWKTLQNRSDKVVPAGKYTDVFGATKCTSYGEEVTFIANDWHAGALSTAIRGCHADALSAAAIAQKLEA